MVEQGLVVRRQGRGELWQLPARSPRLGPGLVLLLLSGLGSLLTGGLGLVAFETFGSSPGMAVAIGLGVFALGLGTLTLLVLGLAFLRSRGSLVLERDRIGWREHGVGFRWTHWRPASGVEQVEWDLSDPGDPHPLLRLPEHRPLHLAALDPPPLREEVARGLAQHLGVPLLPLPVPQEPPVAASAALGAGVERARPADPAHGSGPPGDAPAPAGISVVSAPSGWSLEVPAQGLWRGSHGLFPFGLIWSAMTAGMFAVFLVAGFEGSRAIALVLFLVFALVGTLTTLYGVELGTRTTRFELGREGPLRIVQRSRLRSGEFVLQRADLRGVAVSDSQMRVNGKPVLQLELRHARGRWTGLRMLRAADLDWVRERLERALAVTRDA